MVNDTELIILIPKKVGAIYAPFFFSKTTDGDALFSKLDEVMGCDVRAFCELKWAGSASVVEPFDRLAGYFGHKDRIQLTIKFQGGANKVMKHMLKKNIPAIKAGDEAEFGASFRTSLTISGSTTYDLTFGVNELSQQDLLELKEGLAKGNKAPNSVKIDRPICSLGSYKQVEFSIQKLMQSLEVFKNLVEADIEKNYMTKDGAYDMEKIREVVAVAIALKTSANRTG